MKENKYIEGVYDHGRNRCSNLRRKNETCTIKKITSFIVG